MATNIELALMSGDAYESTRGEINRFPVPTGWVAVKHETQDSGFEAVAFVRDGTTLATSTEIVISFSGTDPNNSGLLSPDGRTNGALAAGTWADQLMQAAEYYLQIKAANPGATITLTGHSLGGGLAALVGVFFGVPAQTFDQAPFAKTAWFMAPDTMAYLVGQVDASGNRLYSDAVLAPLASYIAQKEAFGAAAILDDGLMASYVAKMALHAANYSAWKVAA